MKGRGNREWEPRTQWKYKLTHEASSPARLMWMLPSVSQLVPSSVPAPGIHSMVGLGAPPAMEDPIPCPWSRNRLLLIRGREGLRAGSIQLLELLSPWKQRAGPLCEHRKGSSFSEGIRGTSLSGLPASWLGWGWGALRVTGLPHHSVSSVSSGIIPSLLEFT